MNRIAVWVSVVLSLSLVPTGVFGQAPQTRVLVIGIDGLRPDALKAAKTPALDSLIEGGCFSEETRILGERYRKNDTVSGPGWSSFLTGVWADKHGVNDNGFKGKNYEEFPHFFARLKSQFPDAYTASFVDWAPIDKHIVSHADVKKVYPAKGADGYTQMDQVIAGEAETFLSDADPHATVVYFGAVDETGHRDGFHPSVASYLSAIETVDGHVTKLLDAVRSRPHFKEENWLFLVSTDHGGRGTGHGGGHEVPEIYTTFLIVSGGAAIRGKLIEPTFVVDLPVTALTHLGVRVREDWRLDGKAVGLKR